MKYFFFVCACMNCFNLVTARSRGQVLVTGMLALLCVYCTWSTIQRPDKF